MRALILLGILLFTSTAICAAQNACVARSGARRAHLVELYTSEGCSSCPPADRWLKRIGDSADIVALGFHVDYWDSSRWRDRFSDPRFTARQRVLSGRSGSGVVYTPEVALDGREWQGWSHQSLPAGGPNASTGLTLHVDPGKQLHLSLDVSGSPDSGARAYFALTQSGLVSRVAGGENSGATLHHDHVVRAFAGPLPLAHAAADLALPADVDRRNASIVAFVQNPHSGVVDQVVHLPMSACEDAKSY
ncbi:MAG: DUF1223 domain-containing protein [Rhodanobacteraceae bacterium]